LLRLAVNGQAVPMRIEKGYAIITREWRAGDRIELELPMAVQRVTAAPRIDATRGKVALRYGPLVYNVERADQPRIDLALGSEPLVAEWRRDLLGGVMVIRGRWSDGSVMTAVPNFARSNRTGAPIREFPGEPSGVEYAPGTASAAQAEVEAVDPRPRRRGPETLVWIGQNGTDAA
jgi:hypothetical protein